MERPNPSPRHRSKEEEEADWEEAVTASDVSGEVVEIKKWRGRDENGEPVTWVEERRTRGLSTPGVGRDI